MIDIAKKEAPSADRSRELLAFSERLGITFNDLALLETALTHTSYANETGRRNNERLEFLGDSVLGLVSAEYLYRQLPDHQEGDMSRYKAAVVSEKSLAAIARTLGFPRMIRIGHGEQINGGRDKDAILADAMEAVIAALYIDQGFEAAKTYVLSWIKDPIERVLEGKNSNKDYKSMLQAHRQKHKGKVPEYLLDRCEGPEHRPTFYVKVFLGNQCFGPAAGSNKKEAEQNVARLALISLGVIGPED